MYLYADMRAEQNILTERVYGEIRSYCRHNYGIDFHVSVLRFIIACL